jgi:hypothetical protein
MQAKRKGARRALSRENIICDVELDIISNKNKNRD